MGVLFACQPVVPILAVMASSAAEAGWISVTVAEESNEVLEAESLGFGRMTEGTLESRRQDVFRQSSISHR